jgi:hypothetical protein
MKHLSRLQLLDIIEEGASRSGPPETAARQHLAQCEACRAHAAALEETLAEARRDPGGEPSPLFWDHFAARVSAAIREEPLPAAPSSTWWRLGPAAAWIPVAILAVLAITSAAWHTTVHAPAPAAGTARIDASAGAVAADDLDADEAWSSVRAAVDGLMLDEAQEAGIGAAPGAVERVATEMTPEERAELGRLLEAELKRSGA